MSDTAQTNSTITGGSALSAGPSKAGFFRGPWSIAVYTWREGIRKKTLIGFVILSLLVIFGANVISAFVTEMPGATTSQSDVDIKLIKDICMTTISIFGVLIAIFISASVVPNEVENKVIYTVLSKPVRRFQYLLGKFIGVQMVVLANLILMAILFSAAIYFKQAEPPTLLMWAVLLVYFEFLVVSSLTFAVSCTSSSAVLPTIFGLFIYITGHMTEYLRDVSDRLNLQGEDLGIVQWAVAAMAKVLFLVLPNLEKFNIRDQIIHFQPSDAPQGLQTGNLFLYAMLWTAAGLVASYWIFRRREL
jgi:ABC-type transport system involved in multi-copper enzyme maturation permease subunit